MQSLIHCLQAATVATNAGVTNTEELFLISKTLKTLKSKKDFLKRDKTSITFTLYKDTKTLKTC